jgi:hypothetical protein
MRILSALLAILLGATSCAGSSPSSRPVLAVPENAEIEDGVAEVAYHGIPGMFFTFEAWRNVLIKVRLERKDLEVALATETVGRELAEIEANMLRANQAKQQWAATYGPWLGFAGGLTVAAIIAGVFGGVFQGVVNGK